MSQPDGRVRPEAKETLFVQVEIRLDGSSFALAPRKQRCWRYAEK
jgi:hypothetical protein